MMKRLSFTKRQTKSALNHFTASSDDNIKLTLEFYESLDTAKSLAASILLTNGEYEQLIALDLNPNDYLSVDLFHRDYLAVSFLSKNKFLKLENIDKKEKALLKFQKMEFQCFETNQRLKASRFKQSNDFAAIAFAMQCKISSILGDFDSEEFFESTGWGPGVSTLIKGEDTSASNKFQSETGITCELYALLQPSLMAAYPNWFREEHICDSSIQIQEGNTVTTVDKNAKIDRVIAIEPGLNLFFQKSLGSMIRRRLMKIGVNLQDQSRNQMLAKEGSLKGNLATVDFSSASDSIAERLVWEFLPERWFTVLDSCRSKRGKMQLNGQESKLFRWEKFSSMGNGFTFELESLIFYSAAWAVSQHLGLSSRKISVYGDDVIIRTEAYPLFVEFCEYLGFTVNLEKSFSHGYFRESCGAHWFNGVDVKPIFFKEGLTDASSVYKLANSIRRLSHSRGSHLFCDIRFMDYWNSIASRLPPVLRSVGIPDGFGDGGLVKNFDEVCPSRNPHQHEGFTTLCTRQESVKRLHYLHGHLLAMLHALEKREPDVRLVNYVDKKSLSTQSYGNKVAYRGRTTNQVFKLVVSSWYNMGPWL